jgi:predicted RNA polymerase sigma factor
MSGAALERVFREASGRIVGALAARFRNLALAEDRCTMSYCYSGTMGSFD